MSDGGLRVLLFSDLLLDRPYEWAPPALAVRRRAIAREARVELLGAARQHHVDVVACAGNLFDRRTVRPATIHWLVAALRSAGVPVLIAPGGRDFVDALGGYAVHTWPDNVTIFDTTRFSPKEIGEGFTIWGACHTEAHRSRSFFDTFRVDRQGVNLALFNGAEAFGTNREPGLEPSATWDEGAAVLAGFDHALVGHYQQPHFGRRHTYPGAPIAHEFGTAQPRGAVLLTVDPNGGVEQELLEIPSPALRDAEVDLTGTMSEQEVVARTNAVERRSGDALRLRLTGRISPDLILRRADFLDLAPSDGELVIVWDVELDIDFDELAAERTVRGQFVRQVLASPMSDERRQRILLIGLRALAGHHDLEGAR